MTREIFFSSHVNHPVRRSVTKISLLSSSGFSLLEMMIVLGLMAVTFYSLMSIMDLQSKMGVAQDFVGFAQDVKSSVQGALADVNACPATLGGKPLSGPAATLGTGTQIKLETVVSGIPTLVTLYTLGSAPANQILGKVYIGSMSLSSTALIPPSNSGPAWLTLDLESTRAVTGSKTVNRTIPLWVTLDASSNITACYAIYTGPSGANDYVTHAELQAPRGGTILPINRSWLAMPGYADIAVSSNNPPTRAGATLDIPPGTPIILGTYTIAGVDHDRLIDVHASVFAIGDGGIDRATQLNLNLNGAYVERQLIALDKWAGGAIYVSGVTLQTAGAPVTVTLEGQWATAGGTIANAKMDQNRIHVFFKEL